MQVPYVIRLKVPRPGTTTVNDALRDPIDFDNGQIDDQILLKADDAYVSFSECRDDHLMKIFT